MLGEAIEFEDVDVGHGAAVRQARSWGDQGVRAEVQEDALAFKDAGSAIVQFYFDGFGFDERGFAEDKIGAGGLIKVEVRRDLGLDHFALSLTNGGHVD